MKKQRSEGSMIKSKIDINRIARVLTMEDNIKESFNIIS